MELVMIQQTGEIKNSFQRGKVKFGKLGNQACQKLMKTHSPNGLLRNRVVSLRLESKSYLKQLEIMHI